MSTTQTSGHNANRLDRDLVDRFIRFYRDYYRDEIGTLAQQYPDEKRSLEVAYKDVYQWDNEVADDWIEQPSLVELHAKTALREFDLPVDITLDEANVRLVELPNNQIHYPGHYSPERVKSRYPHIGVRGEITANTEVYPMMTDAAFECQRCGTLNRIPQEMNDFQEPHDCQGCDREGPFNLDFDSSEFMDAQKLRIAEPPEVAGGEGRKIDVLVEDDLAGKVEAGDRIIANGELQFQQVEVGNEKKNQFDTFLTGSSIEVESSDGMDLEITPEEREEIEAIAGGKYGPPLDAVSQSIAAGVFGEEYDHMKKALTLSVAGGEWVHHEDGSVTRGSINVLLVGDPGTAKSQLIKQVENHAPRSVGVSGKGVADAGITAAAVRSNDDFSDGQWTLKAGAFAKANGGILRVDELDDMPADIRSSMLEPMANGEISVSKAGINTTLQTRVGVVAAANPKFGRFDQYEPFASQVELDSALISRFDLAYTLTDNQDYEKDMMVGTNIIDKHEYSKQKSLAEDRGFEMGDEHEPEIKGELLTKYLAVARDQPSPVFANKEEAHKLVQEFAEFRDQNVDEDSPIPATFRKLQAMIRLSEAAAKIEFSPTIEQRHLKEAISLVMKSMTDFGMNEEGEFDADVVETGNSKPQRDRLKILKDIMADNYSMGQDADIQEVADMAAEEGLDRKKAVEQLRNLPKKEQWAHLKMGAEDTLVYLGE